MHDRNDLKRWTEVGQRQTEGFERLRVSLEVEAGPASACQTLCAGSVVMVWKRLPGDPSASCRSRTQYIFLADPMVTLNPSPRGTGVLCG